jgi:hypothetical protein
VFVGVAVLNPRDRVPVWAWRSVLALALGAALLALGLLVATLLGAADPRPQGELSVDDTFAAPSRWHLSANGRPTTIPPPENGRLEIALSASGDEIVGAFTDPIGCPCTVELRAEQLSGGRDARYGLWWGDSVGLRTALVGINSDGYMGIEPGSSMPGRATMEWQLFPHVRPSGQVNNFRADIDANQVTVRLNDEIAARVPRDGSGPISAGLFVRASPHDAALIAFLDFKVWETKSTGP